MGSKRVRKSSKWVREAVCTITTDVSLTADFTDCRFYRWGREIWGAADFTECRFYRQGRGFWGAPHGRWPKV